jgi:CRP-like cAMP-binding protein
MNDTDFLATVSLFSHLKKRDLRKLAKLSRQEVFQKGDVIVREGDRDGRLYIVLTGAVEVIKNFSKDQEQTLRTLGPNSYFGEMALIENYIRSASVVAKTQTTLLYLDQWDLRREILKHPILAIELLQLLTRRIHALEKSMVDSLGTALPICRCCNRVRTENGSWVSMEEYVKDDSDAETNHNVCPECEKR